MDEEFNSLRLVPESLHKLKSKQYRRISITPCGIAWLTRWMTIRN